MTKDIKLEKQIGVISLSGSALIHAAGLKSELLLKGRYESSWNVIINRIVREWGEMKQAQPDNKIEIEGKSVKFSLSGVFPNKADAKEKMHALIDELLKGGKDV